jgi:paraquat-inducible protein B
MVSGLRAQLGTQGITGVKLVDIDFFDATTTTPKLPFSVGDHYIPSTPSLLKALEEPVQSLAQSLPEFVGVLTVAVHKVDAFLDDVNGQQIPEHVRAALDDVRQVAIRLQTLVANIDSAKLPGQMATALDGIKGSIARLRGVLDDVSGDAGLVGSVHRTSDSLGDLGRSASRSTNQLDRTLRDVDEAASAIRDLADAIEHDPDMIVKGRAKARAR